MGCGKVSQRVWPMNQVLKEWIGPLGRETSQGIGAPGIGIALRRGCRINREKSVMADSCTPVLNLNKSQFCFI